MAASDEHNIPVPVQVLLQQEIDEECDVFLVYKPIAANDEYTDGKLAVKSNLTEAEYTITDKFSVPVENIQKVESDIETDNREIWLHGCSKSDIENLFNSVSIAYSLGTETAEIDTDFSQE